jgi:NAD(P)-dependent dehydrogenase (short-subunit alcohol dehydrogenase family)
VRAYRRAKLALAVWSFDLADELAGTGIVVNCIHPATLMDTTMVRVSGYPQLSTVDDGGAAMLRMVLDVDTTGDFYDGLRVSRAHPDAYRPEVRAATDAMLDRGLSGNPPAPRRCIR